MRSACIVLLLAFATAAHSENFILGVSTHYGLGIGNPANSMSVVQDAGFNSIRDEILWSRVEKEKGQLRIPPEAAKADQAIELAKARGIEPLMILCYGNKHYGGGYPLTPEARAAFVRYAEFMVRHYKGKVRYWELWNEWNEGMGDKKNEAGRAAEEYAKLLKEVYPAVKAIDPNIVLLGGAVEGAGSTRWIEDLFDAGAGKYMDGLSVHPYVFHAGKVGTPERLYGWLTRLVERLNDKPGGANMPLYITEIGWPNEIRGDKGISREVTRDYIARVLLSVRSVPQVKGVWWYTLQDYDRGFVGSFGLLEKNGDPKPAYEALKDVAPLIRKATTVERLRADKDAWVLKLSGPDLKPTYAIWNPSDKPHQVVLRLDTTAPEGFGRKSRAAGLKDQPTASMAQKSADRLRVKSNATPVLIEEDEGPVGVRAVEVED